MANYVPASKTTLNQINALAKRIFRNEAKKIRLTAQLRAAQARAKARYSPEILQLQSQIDKDGKRLSGIVKKYRTRLIESGKSFATMHAKFQYRENTKLKIVNPQAVEALVRKLKITKPVSVRTVHSEVKPDLLEQYLDDHPELKPEFNGLVEWPGQRQNLSIKPNESYLTTLDGTRLSDKAIPLPSSD